MSILVGTEMREAIASGDVRMARESVRRALPGGQGVIFGRTNERYHADLEWVSSTRLKRIERSPADFQQQSQWSPSHAKTEGSAAHALLEGAAAFDEQFVVSESDARTGASWAQAAALARATKRQVITREQFARCSALVEKTRGHPDVRALTALGVAEPSVFWVDKATQVKLKCRPDFLSLVHGRLVCVDWKTTDDASPRAVRRTIEKFRYHVSAAMYCEGTGASSFVWVFIERDGPQHVCAYECGANLLAEGRRLYRGWLETLSECSASGKWPGIAHAGHGIHVI